MARFLWSTTGEELKRFSFEDVMGFVARRAGPVLKLGLISGEDSPLVDRFAEKIGILNVAKGCKEKGKSHCASSPNLREFRWSVSPIIGDDVNDLPGAGTCWGLP